MSTIADAEPAPHGFAVVFDCETTGFDEPDVIELAHTEPMIAPFDPAPRVNCSRFKPRKPITYGALATHHIFEGELAQCEPWTGTWSPPLGTEYLIGHNVDYDWKAIGSPDIKRICTLALTRRHWPDVDSHTLGAMTYATATHQDCYELRERLQFSHSAGTDVFLTQRLLSVIVANIGAKTWDELWQASEIARVPLRFSFGKFKGKLISDIRKADRGYISWCLNQDFVREDPYLAKALRGETA